MSPRFSDAHFNLRIDKLCHSNCSSFSHSIRPAADFVLHGVFQSPDGFNGTGEPLLRLLVFWLSWGGSTRDRIAVVVVSRE